MDDDQHITAYDWDRDQKGWRALDEIDDGGRFAPTTFPETLENGIQEVAVAVSASYYIKPENIGRSIPNVPIVELKLDNCSFDFHWSLEKQIALVKQFREVIVHLESLNVKLIHLFIAAPNSLVFKLGTSYDLRNMPRARVYQYEQSDKLPFPWSVELPRPGTEAKIISTPAS